MPGNVAFSNPSAVLPFSLSLSFREERAWALNQNLYCDGTSQRLPLVTDARRTWRLAKHLPTALLDPRGNPQPNMDELRIFYVARNGPMDVFWFYDLYEPAPNQPVGSNYDATGLSAQGRHPVRFDGAFSQQMLINMATADVVLVEVV